MDIFNECIKEFGTEENQKKIQSNIISPILNYIHGKVAPYIVCIFLMQCIILIGVLYLCYQKFHKN